MIMVHFLYILVLSFVDNDTLLEEQRKSTCLHSSSKFVDLLRHISPAVFADRKRHKLWSKILMVTSRVETFSNNTGQRSLIKVAPEAEHHGLFSFFVRSLRYTLRHLITATRLLWQKSSGLILKLIRFRHRNFWLLTDQCVLIAYSIPFPKS